MILQTHPDALLSRPHDRKHRVIPKNLAGLSATYMYMLTKSRLQLTSPFLKCKVLMHVSMRNESRKEQKAYDMQRFARLCRLHIRSPSAFNLESSGAKDQGAPHGT